MQSLQRVFLLFVFVSCGASVSPAQQDDAGEPRTFNIEFQKIPDVFVVDVGSLPIDSVANCALQLINATGQDLRIADVTKDCSCVLLSTPESMTFDDSSHARVNVGFKTKKLAARIGHTIKIYFQGYGTAPLTVQLRAQVRGSVWIEQQIVNIDSETRDVRLDLFLDTDAAIRRISALHGFLKIQHVGQSVRLDSGIRRMPIDVRPVVVAGNVTEYVRVEYAIGRDEKSMDIPITVRKAWSLRTIPRDLLIRSGTLSFSLIESDPAIFDARTATVVLEGRDGKPLTEDQCVLHLEERTPRVTKFSIQLMREAWESRSLHRIVITPKESEPFVVSVQ